MEKDCFTDDSDLSDHEYFSESDEEIESDIPTNSDSSPSKQLIPIKFNAPSTTISSTRQIGLLPLQLMLGADGNALVREHEVRHLGEAVPRDRIGSDQLDVALFENVADVAFLPEFHTLAL